MNPLRKLKGFFRGVFGDMGLTSAESREEVQANLQFRSGGNAEGGAHSPKSQWLRHAIPAWQVSEIRSWVRHMAPFGTQGFLISAFRTLNLTNGHRIKACDFKTYLSALQSVSSQEVTLKHEVQLSLLLNLSYVKHCYDHQLLYDRSFDFCMRKILSTQYVEEYQRLLNLAMLGRLEEQQEEDLERLCFAVISYAFVLLNKEPLFNRFKTFFEQALARLSEEQEAAGYPLVCKIILVDQVAEAGRGQGGETAESQMLQERTKKVLSPLVAAIPFLRQVFGMFHVGLQIGHESNYVEWTTASFICPRRLESMDSLLSIDLRPKMITYDNYADVAAIIAEMIYTFNAQKEYNLVRNNCQHFVMEMCKVLDIEVRSQLNHGAMAKYMARVKNTGCAEMVFQPSKEFVARYGLSDGDSVHFRKFYHQGKSNVFRFDTHMDLDEFGINLLEAARGADGNDIDVKNTSEWRLLHGWDEAEWIKYFSSKRGQVGRDEFEKSMYYHREDDHETILCPYLHLTTETTTTPTTPTPSESEREGENEEEEEHDVGGLTAGEENIRRRIMEKNEEWNSRWYENYSQEAYAELLRSQLSDAFRTDDSQSWMFD